MKVQELLSEWRQTYAEWVSAELQLRVARREKNSGRVVPLLEEKVRRLQQQCSECQDAVSDALADRHVAVSQTARRALMREHVGR